MSILNIVLLMLLSGMGLAESYPNNVNGNVCTFRYRDKLFSLVNSEAAQPYSKGSFENGGKMVMWNFCLPFRPQLCLQVNTGNITVPQAFSFVIERQQIKVQDNNNSSKSQTQPQPNLNTDSNATNNTDYTDPKAGLNQNEPLARLLALQPAQYKYKCTPYTSDSSMSLYNINYIKGSSVNNSIVLTLNQKDPRVTSVYKKTVFTIHCSTEDRQFRLINYKFNDTVMQIQGSSISGCPLFEISSLWRVLQDHKIIFGVVLFCLGLFSLFFGRQMLTVTIFIAAYFISFILLSGLFTIFLRPNTSSIVVYFALIFLLFVSTLVGYAATKLVNVSIFCIGAWLGFIAGALVNSIFSKMFNVYSIWSLVVFEVLFMIPCGLLTFKYADIVVIISTSLTGAYMTIRPISWIFGGFPNQFLLQELIESGQLSTLPWTFFIYLASIIALSLLGAMYQFLKLRRQDPTQQIEVSFIEAEVERSVDRVKSVVDGLIQRYKSDSHSQDYKKMKELQDRPRSDQFH